MMDDLKLAEEIEGRLAEMEIAAGRMVEGSRALAYLHRELEGLLVEAREHEQRWIEVVRRAERLAARLRR